jgi:hypothetical protein
MLCDHEGVSVVGVLWIDRAQCPFHNGLAFYKSMDAEVCLDTV